MCKPALARVAAAAFLLIAFILVVACGTPQSGSTRTSQGSSEGTISVQGPTPTLTHVRMTATEQAVQTLAPTAAASATRGIWTLGSVNLFADPGGTAIPDGYVDLDTGATGPTHVGDLVYLVLDRTDALYVLRPVNGASAVPMGTPGTQTPVPLLEDCAQAEGRLSTADVPAGSTGAFLCVLTNEGRSSLVRIDWVDELGPYSLRIRFVTWE